MFPGLMSLRPTWISRRRRVQFYQSRGSAKVLLQELKRFLPYVWPMAERMLVTILAEQLFEMSRADLLQPTHQVR